MDAYRWFDVTLVDESMDPGDDAAYHTFRVYTYERGRAITYAYAQADNRERRRVPYAVHSVTPEELVAS